MGMLKVWDGTQWQYVTLSFAQQIRHIAGATYTLLAQDVYCELQFTNPGGCTISVPSEADSGITEVAWASWSQYGGQLTFIGQIPGGGPPSPVTVNGSPGNKSVDLYSTGGLKYEGLDVWTLSGRITA